MLLPLLQESGEMVHFGSKCSWPREGGKKITASTEPEGVITYIIREESRNLHTKR
jgi:hypothetical protein